MVQEVITIDHVCGAVDPRPCMCAQGTADLLPGDFTFPSSFQVYIL